MRGIAFLLITLLVANVACAAWIWFTTRKYRNTTPRRGGPGSPGPSTGSSGTGSGSAGTGTGSTDTGTSAPDFSEQSDCSCSQALAGDITPGAPKSSDYFFIAPMVQIGRAGSGSDSARTYDVDVLFAAVEAKDASNWTLEAVTIPNGTGADGSFPRVLTVAPLSRRHVKLETIEPHFVYRTTVSGLSANERFTYRVMQGGVKVFEASAATRKAPGTPYRFVVVGDMGSGSVESAHIAHKISLAKPDLLAITGDVVYKRGRVSEYMSRFFPMYNADAPDSGVGAPLLRSVLSFTSAGNHCVGKTEYWLSPSFDEHPDLFAYFLYWSMPLNGPQGKDATRSIPELNGDARRIERFKCAAGETFPTMANYSFDFGDAHWLVLDANAYMDWTDEKLVAWVEADLAATKTRWKFVNYHQPAFTSEPKHKQEKRMRLLAPLLEKYGVDVVFCGHAHYYERIRPVKFQLEMRENGKPIDENGYVGGQITCDMNFDGETVTKPDGVVYLVTGAGGAKLDANGLTWRKELWKPFTHKVLGDRYSFTVCDLDGDTLTIRQIDVNGREVDKLVITK